MTKSEDAIKLIDTWLADESGYDEKVWLIIKKAIEDNRLSNRRQFCMEPIQELEHLYTITDATAVNRFLEAHPHLVGFLLDAHAAVLQYFGSDAMIALEVVTDPEASQVEEELFANIVTPLSVDEALIRLNALDEGWFLKRLDQVGALFNFDVRFV